MSVIIRLQNLPWSANALDIRQYFHGLSIPEGGVHIVGGEQGDAFIAFSTDEDARQAFMRNNGKIKEVQISLMLSSRTEMHRVIEQARAMSLAAFMQPNNALNPPATTNNSIGQQPPQPAAVPAVLLPDNKKDKGDKSKERKRSKSRDRDRRARSRDKDRKDRRHRSRSRSRDRKSRRRERSRSRNRSRSRSRDRDRRRRDDKNKRPLDKDNKNLLQKDKKPLPEVWASNPNPVDAIPQTNPLLTALGVNFEPPNRNLTSILANGLDLNIFNAAAAQRLPDIREQNWTPNNNFHNNRPNNNNFPVTNNIEKFGSNNRFQRGFNNRMPESDCCVALEPFFGAYGDVRKFFQGMFISNRGIKFINDNDGRRTGVVYVQFMEKSSKNQALNLDGSSLNGLNVSVCHLDDDEFAEAVDRFVPNRNNDEDDSSQSGNNFQKFRSRNITKYFNKDSPHEMITDFSCLILEDLPSICKEQDILHMFNQYTLVALILTKTRNGHIAYVKFSNKEHAKKACEETSNHIINGKPVSVRPCKDEEFEEINKEHDVNFKPVKSEDELETTNYIKISKLPNKTTDKDIVDFFSDIGVIPSKIHLKTDANGFTGEAFCEFDKTEDATKALKKNDAAFGNENVSVVFVPNENVGLFLSHAEEQQEEEIPEKQQDIIVPPMHMMRGNFGGHPRRPFMNRNFDMRGPRFGPRGMGHRMRFGPHKDADEVPPGCTVYMKNVPYKAGTNEILNFFNGYQHTGSVSRRYNPNNTPSDEAKIFFFNAEEASRAVEELQKVKIWDRPIFLRQE